MRLHDERLNVLQRQRHEERDDKTGRLDKIIAEDLGDHLIVGTGPSPHLDRHPIACTNLARKNESQRNLRLVQTNIASSPGNP